MYMYGSFLLMCVPVICSITNAGVEDHSNDKPSPLSSTVSQAGQPSPCEQTAVVDHWNAKPSSSSTIPSGGTSREKTSGNDQPDAKTSPSSSTTSLPGRPSPCRKTTVEDHSNAKLSPSSRITSRRTYRRKTSANDQPDAKTSPSSSTTSLPGQISPCKKTTVEDHSNDKLSPSSPIPSRRSSREKTSANDQPDAETSLSSSTQASPCRKTDAEGHYANASPLPIIPQPGQSYHQVKTKNESYVVVDKTDFIRRLIDNDDIKTVSKVYFLTRPKTFGKTFFLSTVYAFLNGQKNLFKGTAIESRGNAMLEEDGEWKRRPVIKIDFSALDAETVESFRIALQGRLNKIAEEHQITSWNGTGRIGALIEALKSTYEYPVSILIDEFDSPVIFAQDEEVLRGIEKMLNRFYLAIRSAAYADDLWLVLILGVSRLQVFSGPMNGVVNDITFDDKFSSIMGFLANETRQSFKLHLDKFAEKKGIEADDAAEKIEARYGGYRFCMNDRDGKVQDPGSVCSALRRLKVADYETKTPALEKIVEQMIKERISIDDFKFHCVPDYELDEKFFTKIEKAVPLYMEMLFHGYLTIKQYREKTDEVCLDYPNEGVQRRIERALPVELRSKFPTYHGSHHSNLRQLVQEALNKCDMNNFVELLIPQAFPVVSSTMQFPVSKGYNEFVATGYIFRALRTLGLNCKEGRLLVSTKDGGPAGDLDLMIFATEKNMPHYAISNKFHGQTAYQAITQLFEYVVKHTVEFERLFKEQVQTNVINLVGLQCKKDKDRHMTISAWILVPYFLKDQKIGISETRASHVTSKIKMAENVKKEAYYNEEKFV